ncbi:unnamed protein product [Ectocarpus sp. 6 AP-2014]
MATALFSRQPGCRRSRSWHRNVVHVSGGAMLLLMLGSVLAKAVRLNPESTLQPADLTGRFGAESTTRNSWRGSRGSGGLHQKTEWATGDNTTSCSTPISMGGDHGESRGRFLRDHAVGIGVGVAAAMSYKSEPAGALFEDFKKEGKCPAYKAVDNFDIDKYMGIWYELAYHDWTQIKICGCTRFNMTRTDDRIKDAFTTKCPYEADEGETFLINMREVIDRSSPGSFKEYAFYNKWDNKVVALWRSNEGQYERAIQLQCVEILGRRAFVGINFLSREPLVAPRAMSEMFQKAKALGLAGIGGSPAEMEIVRHEGCRYPTSSGNKESRSWGSAWGVNTLAL